MGGGRNVSTTGGNVATPMELGQIQSFRGNCNTCGEWGHKANQCRKRAAGHGGEQSWQQRRINGVGAPIEEELSENELPQ